MVEDSGVCFSQTLITLFAWSLPFLLIIIKKTYIRMTYPFILFASTLGNKTINKWRIGGGWWRITIFILCVPFVSYQQLLLVDIE